MPFLIDGYNLLHVTAIFGSPTGPPTLERSRTALLDFLAAALDARSASKPSSSSMRRRPRRVCPPGTRTRGSASASRTPGNADELIEQLIDAHPEPRQLIVVSSDHRLHRAARRRRATAVDSEIWYLDALRRVRSRQSAGEQSPAKPDAPTPEEVRYWLRQFGHEDPPPGARNEPPPESYYPFPPGYGEDVVE